MPSASNAKSEKPVSSETTDNSPVRQILTIIEHKIRNLEKRKGKLTSYRDLQKAGKELNADQKVAVAKYDEVVQTLDFARDISKQVMTVATAAEREAKKQAKKEAWVRYAAETNKIREVLLILDCLMQMGNMDAREDFLNGTNGAAKLTADDLKILDDLYPEVTPKHELSEEGQPSFQTQTMKAAEHLYAIIDGKPKEVLGTTYAHIKEIVSAVHVSGYFDKTVEMTTTETEENYVNIEEDPQEIIEDQPPMNMNPNILPVYPPTGLPVPPAPAVVPAPGYPLRAMPPITLQEVEHAYFTQQYPQQRPITEVIGSQNFFFLQESEIDSPVETPQPPPILNQPSPTGPIPSQTFTNQHYVQLPPQAHYAPHPEHPAYSAIPLAGPLPHVQPTAPPHPVPPVPISVQHTAPQPTPILHPVQSAVFDQQPAVNTEEQTPAAAIEDDDEWKESQSPDHDSNDRKSQGQGDGQNRYRRYGRGRPSNGYRGRGSYQGRQNNDGYHGGRHSGDYQNRSSKDNYQSRQYDNNHSRQNKDNYQNRGSNDGYYGNGDATDNHQHNDSGRDRYNDNYQSYQGGFKSRGRGGSRGGSRPGPRPARPQQYNRKQDNTE